MVLNFVHHRRNPFDSTGKEEFFFSTVGPKRFKTPMVLTTLFKAKGTLSAGYDSSS
jgi:hypothetical protein